MDKFWDAFNKSMIVQACIAGSLTGGVVYLAVVQAPIPEVLSNGFLLMLGYFFGAKGMQEAQSLAKRLSK